MYQLGNIVLISPVRQLEHLLQLLQYWSAMAGHRKQQQQQNKCNCRCRRPCCLVPTAAAAGPRSAPLDQQRRHRSPATPQPPRVRVRPQQQQQVRQQHQQQRSGAFPPQSSLAPPRRWSVGHSSSSQRQVDRVHVLLQRLFRVIRELVLLLLPE